MADRYWAEEVKMRRHDKQHFANSGEIKISLQLTMRERLRKTEWSSYNAKLIRRVGKEKVGNFKEQVQCNALCIALLFNSFFFLLL
jgi:hypothetical protein